MIDFKTMESDVVSDLGIGLTATKGKVVSVRNCWHFYTAGDSVEVMFHNGQEFLDGMNRIFPIVACYDVLILAFVLMDTHVHLSCTVILIPATGSFTSMYGGPQCICPCGIRNASR